MQINFNPYIIFWRKNVSSSANFFPLERVIFPDCNAAILYTLACMETEIFNTTGAPFKKALKPFAYQLAIYGQLNTVPTRAALKEVF